MAPNSIAVANLLRQTVFYHLDNGSWDNALFFSERLLAHEPRSSESTFLLALSHLRLGDHRSAYEVSKPSGYRGLHLGCAFVFAQSCLILGRFGDGVYALEKAKGLWMHKTNLGKHSATSRSIYPDAAVVNCLLGKLCRGMDDRKKAAFYFEDALRMNPLMWDAFVALCDMGVNIRTGNTFRISDSLVRCFEPESTAEATDSAGPLTEQHLPPRRPTAASRQQSAHDMSDPFDHQQNQQNQSHQPQQAHVPQRAPGSQAANSGAGEVEENDFMARIFAARSRVAAGSQQPEGMATPPGAQHELPTAPIRRRPGMPPPPMSESNCMEGQLPPHRQQPPGVPSKIMYRLGASARRAKAADGNAELSAAEQASSLLRATASATNGGAATSTASASMAGHPSIISTSTAERKRTASGHPVAPRHAHGSDEAGLPQRRSARLNMFKTSAGKSNTGGVPIGAGATRELKKARPPISRIVRPGSSGSTVGRVVSGNRKPVDDGGMDVDPMEAPRVREVPTVQQSQQAQHQQAQQVQQPPVLSTAVPSLGAMSRSATEAETARIEEALRWVLELVKKLGSGYLSLAQFQCADALAAFNSLPRVQHDTPWVQAQMGRAQYELAAYAEAETCFRRVRVLAPARLEDMEVFSTILWFLKREADLSFLAHELVDADWHSPQAWCALGNAWSLAQDHEQALRCFRRATQLKPTFAYAYTLQGHEHVLNEEYDKALTAYRQAVTADRRHYNAYYGIGRVYEKLGNFDKAYEHYRIASVIHPTNAVLICCIGKVLERQKQIVPALQYFIKATELAPRAAQTRFRKARALLALGELQAAQQELMILKDLAPDEAAVHFLLGKLYRTLNDKSAAVRHFTIALSLDPKASQKIKQAIGSLEDDEDGLEEYMAL